LTKVFSVFFGWKGLEKTRPKNNVCECVE